MVDRLADRLADRLGNRPAIGLVGLSAADSAWTAIAAATLFAIGICYFWPTMLGVTSERFPEGGALALAIVGGTGTLSAAIFTWILGGLYDRAGPRLALRYMALLPVILMVVFTAIWLYDRRRASVNAPPNA
jgi:MFS family permease